MSLVDFILIVCIVGFISLMGYAYGYGNGQKETCRGYVIEQIRLEQQANEYQRRFDKWCGTQSHKCKVMKGKPI